MTMRLRLLSLALALSLLGLFAAAPLSAGAAKPGSNAVQVPVTGTFTNANGVGTFSGVYNITRFAVQNGQLVALGTLSGTLTDALGNTIGSVADVPVTVPTAAGDPSCQVLDLVLGPLNLNLLGLVVTLNQVHLNITAQSGPGNLLGNLLCAVANLLNNGGPLTGIAALLNQILTQL